MLPQNTLIEQILEIEWFMFTRVNNAGGMASCQMDGETFRIMRTSQYSTWPSEMQQSYLADLQEAHRQGRNLMTEKYARMMETTFPNEYARLAGSLPPLAADTAKLVEEIVAIHMEWKEALSRKYPHLSGRGRPTRTCEDKRRLISVETYLRAELQTYSSKTLSLYYAAIIQRLARDSSEAEENLLNQVRQYGFTSLDEAERYFMGNNLHGY